jgi:Mrp family chromosome partitioning ATPase
MTKVQPLIDHDGASGSKSNRGRPWPRALANGPSTEESAAPSHGREDDRFGDKQSDILPIHTDWLFSACEPHIADLVHRIDVRFSRGAKRVLQFIGVDRGVGSSTVAFAYASASAVLRQRKVLLLSADERRAAPSVLACLSKGSPVRHAVTKLHGTLSYGTLTCLESSNQDAQTLMAEIPVWQTICEEFDEVVVDCRPIETSLLALTIAPRADGVVVVVQAGRTQEVRARTVLDALSAVKAPVLGAVLNQGMAGLPFDSRVKDE